MTGVVANASEFLDKRGYARQGPELGLIPVGGRAGQQCGHNLLGLKRGEPWFRAGLPLAGESRRAASLPGVFPAVADLPRHAQPPGYCGRAQALVEEAGCLPASPFHFCMITSTCHNQSMASIPTDVTLISETQ